MQAALQAGDAGREPDALGVQNCRDPLVPLRAGDLGEAAANVLQRDVHAAEQDDQRQVGKLLLEVTTQAGLSVHLRRAEQSQAVVVPQRARRGPGAAGHRAAGEPRLVHARRVHRLTVGR